MAIPKKYRYDPSAVMGSGCAINIVTGARSFGKTYGWKKACIRDYLKTGRTWGYLRTFDQEIKDIVADGPEAFFSDIMRNDEFPGYKFRCMGRTMQIGKIGEDGEVDKWETMGQLLALTKAQSYKGKSVANMHYVVFDEFIRETRIPPYPKNCVEQFLNLWETLDRREDRVTIVMLANAADVVNPYFVTWKITPPPVGHTKRVAVGRAQIFVQNCWSKAFEQAADKSNIGMLTAGSAYAAYAQMNQFRNDDKAFIKKRPKRAAPTQNIKWGHSTFSLWASIDDGSIYVCEGEAVGKSTYALMREDAEPDIPMIERNEPLLKAWGRYFRQGRMLFESVKVREKFCEVLVLCGVR